MVSTGRSASPATRWKSSSVGPLLVNKSWSILSGRRAPRSATPEACERAGAPREGAVFAETLPPIFGAGRAEFASSPDRVESAGQRGTVQVDGGDRRPRGELLLRRIEGLQAHIRRQPQKKGGDSGTAAPISRHRHQKKNPFPSSRISRNRRFRILAIANLTAERFPALC